MIFDEPKYFKSFINLLSLSDKDEKVLFIEKLMLELAVAPLEFRNKQEGILLKMKKLALNINSSVDSHNQLQVLDAKVKNLILFDDYNDYGSSAKDFFSSQFKELGFQICSLGEPRKYSDYWYELNEVELSDNLADFDDDFFLEEIRGTLNRDYPNLSPESKDTEEFRVVFQDLKEKYQTIYFSIVEYLKNYGDSVKFVVLWGGMFLEPKAIKKACDKFRIPSYAIEFSFDKDKFYFDATGIIGNNHSFAKKVELPNLTNIQENTLDNWFEDDYKKFRRHQPTSDSVDFFIEEEQINVLLLCQCGIDTVITYDSPFYKTTFEAYDDLFKLLANRDDVNLIVKLHPGDLDDNKLKIERLALNQGIDKVVTDALPCDVYELMESCDVGITINSQSGLEMLSKGKNVLCLGNSFFSNQGLGLNLSNFTSLKDAVESLLKYKFSNISNVRKYLYHYLFSYLYSESNVKDSFEKLKSLLVEREKLNKRLLIIHPSGFIGGSGYYLQEFSKRLSQLGWSVKVFCEGTTPQSSNGVAWYRIKYDDVRTSSFLRKVVLDFNPGCILQVGVRSKSMRTALEAYYLSDNAKFIVQAEDDEESVFLNKYTTPDINLLNILDKPDVSSEDMLSFMGLVDWNHTVKVYQDPSYDRWVEPIMRVLCYRLAHAHSSIWFPMAERLKHKFNKPSFILPPVVDLQEVSFKEKRKSKSDLLTEYSIRPDTFIVFINGTVYPYSNEFELFVDSIKNVAKYFKTGITLVLAGRTNAKATNYAQKALKGFAYLRNMNGPSEVDYLAMIDYADLCAAPGINDVFNKYRMSSRLVKPILRKKAFLTFKTGFGDGLCDYYHGLFTRFDNVNEASFLLLLATNDALTKFMTGNSFTTLSEFFDSKKVAYEFDNFYKSIVNDKNFSNEVISGLNLNKNAFEVENYLNKNSYKSFIISPIHELTEKKILNVIESCDVGLIKSEVFAYIGSYLYPENIQFLKELFNYSYEIQNWHYAVLRLKRLMFLGVIFETPEEVYKAAQTLFRTGLFIDSFEILKGGVLSFPESCELKKLLLTVCYTMNEKNIDESKESSLFILRNINSLIRCQGGIQFSFFKLVNALNDNVNNKYIERNSVLRLFDVSKFDTKNISGYLGMLNSLSQMWFLGRLNTELSLNKFNDKRLYELNCRLQSLKENFGSLFESIFNILEFNYSNSSDEICLYNDSIVSRKQFDKGVVIYVSHIFFSLSNKRNINTKQSDSFVHPMKVFNEIIDSCYKKSIPLVFRYQFHNNQVAHAEFLDGWLHISHHTHSEEITKKDNWIHIKQAPLSGYVFLDKSGYSGWSSLWLLSESEVLLVDVAIESVKRLKDKYIKSGESKYLQEEEEFFIKNYVFCPLQIPTDNVANLSSYEGINIVRRVIDIYRDTDVKVVVKRHPLCIHNSVTEFISEIEFLDNVYVSSANIHDLIKNAQAIYTVNSGVGLESLLHNKPVFTFGKSEYRVCTEFVEDLSELKPYFVYDFNSKLKLIDHYLTLLLQKNLIDINSNSITDDIEKIIDLECFTSPI